MSTLQTQTSRVIASNNDLKQEPCLKVFCMISSLWLTQMRLCKLNIHGVVQSYPWFKFYFLLFLGIVMYDNEFETKESKI